MAKPVITFDCDGVFANFTKAFTELVNKRFGTSYSEHWPEYYCVPSYFSKEHWDGGFESVQDRPYFLAQLESYPDIQFRKINAMMTHGVFTGYVVSLRTATDNPDWQTKIWLNNHGLTDLQGVIVGKQSRVEVLKLLGSNAHLDDSEEHVSNLQAAGLKAYLLDRPWNQNAKIDEEYRVCSVDQFLDIAVAPLISEEEREIYFSPRTITDIVKIPNTMSLAESAQLVASHNFKFSELCESYLHSV